LGCESWGVRLGREAWGASLGARVLGRESWGARLGARGLGRLAAETKRHAKAVMPNIARARLMICSPDSIALFYLSAVLRLDEYGSAKPQTGGLSKFPDTGMLKVVPLE
jgi:hypothetical protein